MEHAIKSGGAVTSDELGNHIRDLMQNQPVWQEKAEFIFDAINCSNSGTLSADEIAHVVGYEKSAAVVKAMDFNKDGGDITRAKFLVFLHQLDGKSRAKLLGSIDNALIARESLGEEIAVVLKTKPPWHFRANSDFDKLDDDSSGLIDENELAAVVGQANASACVKAMDVNRDGGDITRAKFKNLLARLDDSTRDALLGTIESKLAE